jgi:hypothetical protein
MTISQVKWASVLCLQKKQLAATPFSFEESVYDKAVDLALGRLSNPDSPFFSHNCYRHAKTHVSRASPQSSLFEEFDDSKTSDLKTCEDNAYLEEILSLKLSSSGILEDHLLQSFLGYTCQETAIARGRSVESVKKARQRATYQLRLKLND